MANSRRPAGGGAKKTLGSANPLAGGRAKKTPRNNHPTGGGVKPTPRRASHPAGGGVKQTLTHVDASGRVRMVDVGDKPVTAREAVARGTITLSAAARRLVRTGAVKKGDPLQTARLAGIMAAKRTSELVPLCHPIPLTSVAVDLTATRTGYTIEARVRTSGQTGVEMEALTAVSVAALTVYDMLKAVDREMVISDICLVEKRGGRSGTFRRGK